MREKILIIEDEPKVVGVLVEALNDAGFNTDIAENGAEGLEKIRQGGNSLVLLDLMLPDMDGFDLLRQAKIFSATPFLILSARDAVPDRVEGLDLGADDYVVKPFILEELLARIRASLRRARESSTTLEIGDLKLDSRNRRGTRGGHPLYLSTTEFALLEKLVRNKGQIVSKREILRDVWEDESGYRQRNLVEVYINSLRHKTERFGAPRLIHTIRKQGYIVEEPE